MTSARVVEHAASPTKDSVAEKRNAAFRRQSTWELKKIKIYTDEEIGSARGMRSQYLKFWNQRVKQLCRLTPNASRNTITTQVNDEWRKEQNSILSEEASIVQNVGGKLPEGLKPGTLHNNQQAIDLAQSELDQTQQKLEMKNICAEEKKRLLANKKRARSQLKRAQEAMRKNLSSKRKKT